MVSEGLPSSDRMQTDSVESIQSMAWSLPKTAHCSESKFVDLRHSGQAIFRYCVQKFVFSDSRNRGGDRDVGRHTTDASDRNFAACHGNGDTLPLRGCSGKAMYGAAGLKKVDVDMVRLDTSLAVNTAAASVVCEGSCSVLDFAEVSHVIKHVDVAWLEADWWRQGTETARPTVPFLFLITPRASAVAYIIAARDVGQHTVYSCLLLSPGEILKIPVFKLRCLGAACCGL